VASALVTLICARRHRDAEPAAQYWQEARLRRREAVTDRGAPREHAAPGSRKAAARRDVRLMGDWAGSRDPMRQVTIEATYLLTGELEAG
jgi:hypothetical protein